MSAGSAMSALGVTAVLTGLTPGITYDFRLVATNTRTTSYGANTIFTTSSTGSAPTVATDAASGVSTGAATLSGTVNPNGSDATYYFEYGTTGAYGSATTPTSAGSGASTVGVIADLLGLNAGATYDFQLVAANAYGTTYGGNLTFTASSATTTTLVDSPTLALPGDRVTLTAAVSPASAIGTIEFSNGSSPVLECAAVTLVSGSATCVTSFTVAGTYRLRATYSGGTGFGVSTSATRLSLSTSQRLGRPSSCLLRRSSTATSRSSTFR